MRALVVSILLAFGGAGFAQTVDDLPILNVDGFASVEAQPDQAVIRYGSVSQAKHADDAIKELSDVTQNALDVAIKTGIPETNLQTSQFNVQPVYDDAKIIGYRASNVTNALVGDIDLLPALLGALADAGVNRIEGIEFGISNDDELQATALAKAVEDAQSKAEVAANSLGVQIGSPITVNIISNDFGGVPVAMQRGLAMEADSSIVPVSPGQVVVEANVSITFEIETQ